MTTQSRSGRDPGIIQTLGSLQFGLVVLITMVLVAVVGTIIPQGRPAAFYSAQYGEPIRSLIMIFRFDVTYRSPIFLGLATLFGLNLILCSLVRFPALVRRAFAAAPPLGGISALPVSVERAGITPEAAAKAFTDAGFPLSPSSDGGYAGRRRTIGYLGASIVHLSLLLFIVGGMVSLLTGLRGQIVLEPGERATEVELAGDETIPLGFEVQLENFDVAFYEDFPGRPRSFVSSVTVFPQDSEPYERDISVNHPLILDGFTVFQSSYGQLPGNIASLAADSAQVIIRLAGTPADLPPITEITIAPYERFVVPGFGDSISVAASEMHTDYRNVGADGGETNPAIKLDVFVHDEIRWSIFAFKRFPGLNMPMYDDIPLAFTLSDLIVTVGEMDANAGQVKYYTVFGVSRDRGAGVMWIASALMMVGLFLSFYVRPRRLWIAGTDDGVVVGGDGRGELGDLTRFISRTLDSVVSDGQ